MKYSFDSFGYNYKYEVINFNVLEISKTKLDYDSSLLPIPIRNPNISHKKKPKTIVTYFLNTKIRFGKYEGNNIQWIIDNDENYLYWLLENHLITINRNVSNRLNVIPFN